MSYQPPIRHAFDMFEPEERLARMLHEAYERYAAQEFGYLPRAWERLTEADQTLRILVAAELVERGLVKVLPDCPHTNTELRRIEARQCLQCGAYPRAKGFLGDE